EDRVVGHRDVAGGAALADRAAIQDPVAIDDERDEPGDMSLRDGAIEERVDLLRVAELLRRRALPEPPCRGDDQNSCRMPLVHVPLLPGFGPSKAASASAVAVTAAACRPVLLISSPSLDHTRAQMLAYPGLAGLGPAPPSSISAC